MNAAAEHRLHGLEPDNLLAFMALLGLLRALEQARPEWCPRVAWTVNEPPCRPVLHVPEPVDRAGVVDAAAEGVRSLSADHELGDVKDVKMSQERAAEKLRQAASTSHRNRYAADLWAALLSDAVVEKGKTRPTPLCFLGAGQTSFLKTFEKVSRLRTPPKRRVGKTRIEVSETDCLRESLFFPWRRLDSTPSFRWDPNEDSRHALRWTAPTDQKETVQHGANRLAVVGLSALTVVPHLRRGTAQLRVLGGEHRRGFTFSWPIWREPISLASVRALLCHPHLDRPETCEAFGIVERRRVRRVSSGRYGSVTSGRRESQRRAVLLRDGS